jgi:hypothetical protein
MGVLLQAVLAAVGQETKAELYFVVGGGAAVEQAIGQIDALIFGGEGRIGDFGCQPTMKGLLRTNIFWRGVVVSTRRSACTLGSG